MQMAMVSFESALDSVLIEYPKSPLHHYWSMQLSSIDGPATVFTREERFAPKLDRRKKKPITINSWELTDGNRGAKVKPIPTNAMP